jgi:large subunit ribosomal protein L25
VSEVRIEAEKRDEFGKGAARRIRRDGKIPAVVYGHGTDPVHITLPGRDLTRALKQQNVLIDVQLADGGNQLTLPKSIQRDPVRQIIEHVDLVVVVRGEKVVVDVPVLTFGSAEPGSLVEHADNLTVLAEATNIPTSIEVDIAGLLIGTTVRAGAVVLPEGVELAADDDFVVVHIVAPQTEAAPVEEEAVETAAEPEA